MDRYRCCICARVSHFVLCSMRIPFLLDRKGKSTYLDSWWSQSEREREIERECVCVRARECVYVKLDMERIWEEDGASRIFL